MTGKPNHNSRQFHADLFLWIGIILSIVLTLNPALALMLGVLVAFLGRGASSSSWTKRSHWLLQGSVVALGAGINLPAMLQAGIEGLGVTVISITLVLIVGNILGPLFQVPRHTRLLISSGTAICGGSAIAAIAGVLKPQSHETAAALGIVFILNAFALILFPFFGHLLDLSQESFGWWAALAIHDTSSVVGAGVAYGKEALALATTIKLARALWIAPLALVFAVLESRFLKKQEQRTCSQNPNLEFSGELSGTHRSSALKRVRFPWFILGFIALATLRWLLPQFESTGDLISHGGIRTLSAALFLIGAGLSPEALRKVGLKPCLLGILLWLLTAGASLLFAMAYRG